jgi:hypothetical protein
MKLHIAAALILAVVSTTTALAGPTLKVNFRNKSDVAVTEIYLVLPGRDWDKNQVAGKPVPPGGRTWIYLADGIDKCVDDIKVVAEDGRTLEKRVRFCGNRTFDYHGRQ